MRIARTSLAIFAVSLALGGCRQPTPPATPVPPAPTAAGYGPTPPPTASVAVPGGASQRFITGLDVPGQWWTLFHSPELSALVAQAMAANPDVDAAQAALRNARELYIAQRSSAYPTAQGSFSVSRQQVPTYYAPPLTGNASQYVYGVHTASLDVAYTPDVFGNLRYQTQTAAAAAEIERYEVEATYLTLTSNVVAAVITSASLRDQIAATQRILAIERRLLTLTRTQRREAQVTALDELNVETQVRQTEQTLPPLRKSLAQTGDLLARLVGVTPSQPVGTAFSLASLNLPTDLPLSIPSQLIEQRPDIGAAQANLAEQSAQVGVAYTNRLPNFSITAQTATQALSLTGLFGPGTLLSTLTAAVSDTFYDHGTLKHRESAAIAAYDEAAAQYRGTVLGGFQNVADSIVALSTDADALVAAERSLSTAQRALAITRDQRDLGTVSDVPVLIADAAYEQASLADVQARTARYTDTAAFIEALGGGWWNRRDVAPE